MAHETNFPPVEVVPNSHAVGCASLLFKGASFAAVRCLTLLMADAAFALFYAPIQQTTMRAYVAGFALLTYDYLLSLGQEITCMWPAKWTLGKALFVFARYSPFVDIPILIWSESAYAPPGLACSVAFQWYAWSHFLALLGVDVIIGLRTWAIWNRGPVSGILIGLAFLGMAITVLYYEIILTESISLLSISLLGFGCLGQISQVGSVDTGRIYITFSVYEGLMFIATCYRGLEHLHRNRKSELISVLYRDAFLGSASLFAISFVSAIMAVNSNAYYFIPNLIARVLQAIVPSRIMLNIRKAAYEIDGWCVPTNNPPTSSSFELRDHVHESI